MLSSSPRLVLASTSSFRKELLNRLRLPFETASPDTDETPLGDETPAATAERLALAKAAAVASHFGEALIIGSDQVAYSGSERFGKPGNRENAILQLTRLSGRTVIFHTAVCLLNTVTGNAQCIGVPTETRFRALSPAEITRYVDFDQPFHCAGSAKSESLGVALLEYMRGDDPTALIGLPLIALCNMLRKEGLTLP